MAQTFKKSPFYKFRKRLENIVLFVLLSCFEGHSASQRSSLSIIAEGAFFCFRIFGEVTRPGLRPLPSPMGGAASEGLEKCIKCAEIVNISE